MRWSSDPQSWGDSERRQHQAALDWCRKNDRVLSQQAFTDRGVSGWKGAHRKAGALGELLKTVGPGDCILVEDTDRWSREAPLDSLNALRDTVNRGIEIHFLKAGISVNKDNFNSLNIILPVFLKSLLANAENDRKAGMINQAMATRRKQLEAGEAVQGRLPAWLTWDKVAGKPVAIAEKVKTVRKVFELCLAGNGVRAIETLMRGTPPISNSRRAVWNTQFIYRLLTDKSVLGFHNTTGTKVYPTVLDDKVFYAAGQRLKERKGMTVAIAHRNSSLFTGLVKCSVCGSSFVRQRVHGNGKRYDYLVCSGNLRGRTACKFRTLRYGLFEESFLYLMGSTELVQKALAQADAQPNALDAVRGELADIQRTCEKYMRLIEGDASPPRRLLDTLKALEDTEAALMEKIAMEDAKAKASTPVTVAYGQFKDSFALAKDPDYRAKVRPLLRDIVDKIVIKSETKQYEVHLRGSSQPIEVSLASGKGGGWAYGPSAAGTHEV